MDPALVSAIPRHVADRHEIVPWKLEKRRLKVLCCEIKVNELDQLSYKSGRTCVPVIAPEFRIFQLLRAHYQATRQMRALDFGVVPEEGRAERRRKKGKAAEKPAEVPVELIDESAFNEIYNKVVRGQTGPIALAGEAKTEPPVQAAPPRKPAESRRQRKRKPLLPLRPSWRSKRILEALPDDASSAAGDRRDRHRRRAASHRGRAAGRGIRAAAAEGELGRRAEDASAAEARREPARLQAGAEGAGRRLRSNAIAHIVLRASRNKAARALLLQVQGGVALGWDGLGEGTEHASQVAMPLATESAFSLVVKTRSHYLGPLQKTPANIRFLATLGKKVPLSALIFPILHRGRRLAHALPGQRPPAAGAHRRRRDAHPQPAHRPDRRGV